MLTYRFDFANDHFTGRFDKLFSCVFLCGFLWELVPLRDDALVHFDYLGVQHIGLRSVKGSFYDVPF